MLSVTRRQANRGDPATFSPLVNKATRKINNEKKSIQKIYIEFRKTL